MTQFVFISESVSDVTYVVYRFYDIFVVFNAKQLFHFFKISFLNIFKTQLS